MTNSSSTENRIPIAASSHALSGPTGRDESIWDCIGQMPIMRNWRVMRDIVVAFTGLPIAVGAWVVLSAGILGGLGLSLVGGIGFPILAMTWVLLIVGMRVERQRLNGIFDLDIEQPHTWERTSGSLLQRAFGYFTSRQHLYGLIYFGLMLPITLLTVAIAAVPLQLLLSPLVVIFGGSVWPGMLYSVHGGMHWVFDGAITSTPESIIAFGLGLLLVALCAIMLNLLTNIQLQLARALLSPV